MFAINQITPKHSTPPHIQTIPKHARHVLGTSCAGDPVVSRVPFARPQVCAVLVLYRVASPPSRCSVAGLRVGVEYRPHGTGTGSWGPRPCPLLASKSFNAPLSAVDIMASTWRLLLLCVMRVVQVLPVPSVQGCEGWCQWVDGLLHWSGNFCSVYPTRRRLPHDVEVGLLLLLLLLVCSYRTGRTTCPC